MPKKQLADGSNAKHILLYDYKRKAQAKKIPFELSEEEFCFFTSQTCGYCGAEPANEKKTKYITGSYIYNGLDRIDNSLGYSLSNIIPCCRQCNIAKNNYSQLSFRRWIVNVYNYMKLGQ